MKAVKAISLITGLLIITLYFTACAQVSNSTGNNTAKTTGKGFVVLELFTSEGCSSCPPADKVLAQIQQESKDKPVYILAYHVDYWNRLGWEDVFSKAEFSQRQSQYSNWLGAQVYTPQLVINGKTELVGSDESAIHAIIADELKGTSTEQLVLRANREGNRLKVYFKADNAPKRSQVFIALVQKEAATKVARGENAGHTLSHVQIVRQLQTEYLNAAGEGHTIVALPTNFDAGNWELLAFIQDQNSGEITAAAKTTLNDITTAK